LESTTPLAPGTSAWARLVLREPALLLPGDRFIIRMFSPVITIGGGVVVDISGRRYRKGDDVAGRLGVLASDDAAERIALLVREAEFGLSAAELVTRTGMRAKEIAAASATVVAVGDSYVDRAWMQSTREQLVKAVREFHKTRPLLPGIARQDLRGAIPAALFDALLASAPELASEGEVVRAKSHKLVLKEDEEQARAKIEGAFEGAGLAVPALADVLAKSGVESARARSLLQILLREKRLVRISDELVFHQSAVERLRRLLGERRGQRFAVPAFKEWTGVSRKYAIPLLEYLDREHVTRRDGDERVVL
ncbi:MAG TPA: SelB C-terminal domain-containing protein, partial [Candidatus Solibacter sp.]|nr:SelB C-terminal domain-containing protein [Candidatus Solibacter sp.]